MAQSVYRYGEVKLTGINNLKGKYKGRSAVVCCSGTTLKDYDDTIVPTNFIRIAVNESIRKLEDRAHFWVLSDDEIVNEYASLCPATTKILCMHKATRIIKKRCVGVAEIFTVNSTATTKNHDNGFEFFSRGTVLIGAIEMARFMGIDKFYIFGLDCYRLKNEYYYDGRRPVVYTENHFSNSNLVRVADRNAPRLYVTPRLKRMVERLDEVRKSGLWKDISVCCVNSPWSQQKAIEKVTLKDFKKMVSYEPDVEYVTDREEVAKVPKKFNKILSLPPLEPDAPIDEKFKKRRGRPKGSSVTEEEFQQALNALDTAIQSVGDELPEEIRNVAEEIKSRRRSKSAHDEALDLATMINETASGSK